MKDEQWEPRWCRGCGAEVRRNRSTYEWTPTGETWCLARCRGCKALLTLESTTAEKPVAQDAPAVPEVVAFLRERIELNERFARAHEGTRPEEAAEAKRRARLLQEALCAVQTPKASPRVLRVRGDGPEAEVRSLDEALRFRATLGEGDDLITAAWNTADPSEWRQFTRAAFVAFARGFFAQTAADAAAAPAAPEPKARPRVLRVEIDGRPEVEVRSREDEADLPGYHGCAVVRPVGCDGAYYLTRTRLTDFACGFFTQTRATPAEPVAPEPERAPEPGYPACLVGHKVNVAWHGDDADYYVDAVVDGVLRCRHTLTDLVVWINPAHLQTITQFD